MYLQFTHGSFRLRSCRAACSSPAFSELGECLLTYLVTMDHVEVAKAKGFLHSCMLTLQAATTPHCHIFIVSHATKRPACWIYIRGIRSNYDCLCQCWPFAVGGILLSSSNILSIQQKHRRFKTVSVTELSLYWIAFVPSFARSLLTINFLHPVPSPSSGLASRRERISYSPSIRGSYSMQRLCAS